MMRLLIVDDEHYIVNYLAALVEAHAPEDLEVYKCYSGMEALELSKSHENPSGTSGYQDAWTFRY